ncbi:FkbM family methyltransferase [Patescibacteria group bacterium]|nr:FkbM family methyltransferase [Patescibacteria group bacterium]
MKQTALEQFKQGYQKYGAVGALSKSARHAARRLKKLPYILKKGAESIYIKRVKQRLPNGQAIRMVQGSPMLLNLNDQGISTELYLTGVHEANSTNFIRQELKPGMTIVEIGANIGYYTLLESKIIGETGKIIAYEPNPENFHALKINLMLNHLEERSECYPYAVGAESGTNLFYTASKGNLSSFAKRDDRLCDYKAIEVKTVALDDVLHEKFDYFRMDVEGYEWAILAGMKRILSAPDAPYGMYIELHSELLKSFDQSAESLVRLVGTYGYRVKKAFFRGAASPSVDSTEAFLAHPWREIGYWETFFAKDKPSA